MQVTSAPQRRCNLSLHTTVCIAYKTNGGETFACWLYLFFPCSPLNVAGRSQLFTIKSWRSLAIIRNCSFIHLHQLILILCCVESKLRADWLCLSVDAVLCDVCQRVRYYIKYVDVFDAISSTSTCSMLYQVRRRVQHSTTYVKELDTLQAPHRLQPA